MNFEVFLPTNRKAGELPVFDGKRLQELRRKGTDFVRVHIGPKKNNKQPNIIEKTIPSNFVADGVYIIGKSDRANTDHAKCGDSFKITVRDTHLRCERTDNSGGWWMNFEVFLPTNREAAELAVFDKERLQELRRKGADFVRTNIGDKRSKKQ